MNFFSGATTSLANLDATVGTSGYTIVTFETPTLTPGLSIIVTGGVASTDAGLFEVVVFMCHGAGESFLVTTVQGRYYR